VAGARALRRDRRDRGWAGGPGAAPPPARRRCPPRRPDRTDAAGPGARPRHPAWPRGVRAGVPGPGGVRAAHRPGSPGA
jgi:hypothetical protein